MFMLVLTCHTVSVDMFNSSYCSMFRVDMLTMHTAADRTSEVELAHEFLSDQLPAQYTTELVQNSFTQFYITYVLCTM